jgi:CubicO group peptidase (beta-lactamase class C family)
VSVAERAALERDLDRIVGRRGIRHAVLAIASGDGALNEAVAAGTARAEGEPMRPDTPFHYASVTKLYTATVVMQLWEQSRLELGAPLTAYLPGALTDGIHRLDGVDRSGAITVRHLLSHTSGLPDYFLEAPSGELSIADRIVRGDLTYTPDDVISRVRRLTPYFPPQDPTARRQRARYSDTNFQLLGAIVATVTGSTFEQAVETQLLQPLGLGDCWFAGHPRSDHPRNDRPSRTDQPSRTAHPRTDHPRNGAARNGTPRNDSDRADHPRPDHPRTDRPRNGTARSDSARSDSARSDSARNGTPRNDSARAGDTRTAVMWSGDDVLDVPRAVACMGPEGGLVGTAAAAIRFLRALVAGEPFRFGSTFGHMQARWNRFGLPRDRTAIMAPSWPIEYGLGVKRFRLPRPLNAGRRTLTLIGHTGASGSWLFWSPEDDLYLAGTVDQTAAAAVPYRFVPKVVTRLRRR